MGGHLGLDKQDAALGVDAAGDELGEQLQGVVTEGRRVLADGDGVLIHHAVDAVAVILVGRPVPECPHIVAQSDVAAGLNAAETDFTVFVHVKTLLFSGLFSTLVIPRYHTIIRPA